ncbi:MAG: hypothetical protein N3A64_01975, partial [Desulfobacterota bacterium]|nr:hypothetical protein [Thermodesulfobacteriota bacterium]
MKGNRNSFYLTNEKMNLFYFTGLLIFIAILVFNGTFFRIRPEEEIPTIDWLTLARLISCGLGFLVGLILIIKTNPQIRFGSITLAAFLLSTILSAINSPHPTIVIGYAILLLGASVLIFGLIQSATAVDHLEQIEWVWFITVVICVIKDAIASIIYPTPEVGGEVVRLG